MSTELSRLSERAKADKTTRFLSLAHRLTPTALMAAFEGLRKDASAGVDNTDGTGGRVVLRESVARLVG